MNGAGWPFCSFLSFLAAYTAVNCVLLLEQCPELFLAAYTAVNQRPINRPDSMLS